MLTRQDYLNGKCSHETYYGQFVTPEITHQVKTYIGVDRINASKDPHFNDIPLREWDSLFCSSYPRVAQMLLKAGDYLTPAGWVCIVKQAARQIKG